MAQRKAFQIDGGQVQPPPVSRAPNALADGLEEFGGKLQQISAKLTESWVQKREREEAAAGAVAGASGTFAPVRTDTRAGNAYDQSGLQSYFERLKIQGSDDVERIYNENRQDPAKLEAALDGYHKGVAGNLTKNIPELVPHYESFFDRASRPFRRQAAEDYDLVQRGARAAEVEDTLANLGLQAERRAMLGTNTPESFADMALDREDFVTNLMKLGPAQEYEFAGKRGGGGAGKYDLAKMGHDLQAYDRAMLGARSKGEFKRAQANGRGERFVTNFANKDWQEDFSIAERDQLVNWMRGEISDAGALREATDRTLRTAVGAVADAFWRGESPGGAAEVMAKARGNPELEAELNIAKGAHDQMAQVRKMPPRLADDAIELERKTLGGLDASDQNYALNVAAGTKKIAMMEQLRDQNEAAIAREPMAWAVDVGVAQLPALLTEDGGLNVAAFSDRIEAAQTVSNLTGRTAAPILRAEAPQLAAALTVGGIAETARAAGAADASSRASFREALRLIEPDYPAVTQIATFAMNDRTSPADGVNVAGLLSRGYTLTQPQEGKPALFKLKAGAEGRAAFDEAFGRYVGDTFAGDAGARARAADGTYAAYAAYAETAPDGLTGAFDDKTFSRAAAAYFGGNKAKVNGGFVFPPYGMGADEFELGIKADIALRLRGTHTPDQIGALVRNGTLQNAADGYFLTVGDSIVVGTDGQPVTFAPRKVPRTESELLLRQALERASRGSDAR